MKGKFVAFLGFLALLATGCANFDFRDHPMKCSADKPCVSGYTCVNGVCMPGTDIRVNRDALDVQTDSGEDLNHDTWDAADTTEREEILDTRVSDDGVGDTRDSDVADTAEYLEIVDVPTPDDGAVDTADAVDTAENVEIVDVPEPDDGASVGDDADLMDTYDAADTPDAQDGEEVTEDVGPVEFCGDGVCSTGENCSSCPQDCGCTGGRVCYHNTCCKPMTCDDLNYECGDHSDYCGGVINCGECNEFPNSKCEADGKCHCKADCTGKLCGDDGCGGSCGDCGVNQVCKEDGTCGCEYEECNGVCCPQGDVCYGSNCCTPKTCAGMGHECGSWGDGCGNVLNCGECNEFPNSECRDGKCVCEPDCTNKQCGDNGCGGECGTCVMPLVCKKSSCVCPQTHVCGDECCVTGNFCYDAQCHAPAMSVVATGQGTCVGSVSAIQCPGTAGTTDCSTISYCGQDAQYQTWDRKWDIRGTDREKVVVDTQTGIAYQYDYVENKDYQHAVAYCNSLDYGGFNDWMLPDMHALLNIVDYGNPSGTQVFNMPTSGTFWTSTVLYNNVDRHWTVSFADGSNHPTDNPEKLYVRCIRITSPSIPNPRFKTETVGDKTRVMDMATGMMWDMNTGPAMDWRQALAYCELQDCCGYSDWRLPNVNELRSLLNMAKGNPATDLPGFDVDIYWTSTHAGRGVTIFKIDFSIGMISQGLQSEKHPVICVRDGAIIYE